MQKIIECPICDGAAELNFKKEAKTFRKEEFAIFAHFYKCNKCCEEFTTTEIDDLNISQVYNQYRELHNIPLPAQIKFIRERYRLSAAKMSALLGFGPNQYSLYEKGDIPNESNSQLIDIISSAAAFKDLIRKKEHLFTQNEFDKLIANVEKLISMKDDRSCCYETMFFDPLAAVNGKNGYQIPSLLKFANMVIFFLKSASLVTRLNKFLFYADFVNFKNTGSSISGYNYAALPYGPVPQDYKAIFDLIEQRGFITTEPYSISDETTERFIPLKDFDASLFNRDELDSMSSVNSRLSKLTTNQIIDLCHEETGWKENKDKKDLISYQKYGFLLKAF